MIYDLAGSIKLSLFKTVQRLTRVHLLPTISSNLNLLLALMDYYYSDHLNLTGPGWVWLIQQSKQTNEPNCQGFLLDFENVFRLRAGIQ